ncbi:PDR/VanB family oxidoreductase [Streptosporangium sp. NPDC049644]|uniref:PDR/VanB family oxidoreductase n=1 Tax=Streptosporangium sp. NPDC049644 TaxID=3155507 RepID=UPI00344704ED
MRETPFTLRLESMTWLVEGVVELRLVRPDGGTLPDWEAGAHITLSLPNGESRSYSLCGPHDDSRAWTVAVHRSPSSRGGSTFIHDSLRVGTRIEVTGPFHTFELEAAPRYLFVAGGIGITPIKAMAERLCEGDSPWELLYCGRSRGTMAYLDTVTAWGPQHVRLHADDEHGGPADLAALLADQPSDTLIYCCGPEAMLAAVEAAAPDPSRVRVERFRPPEPAEPANDVRPAFDVVCAGSGLRVPVTPDVSILDALKQAGVDVPNSCREGICGSCETKVIQGVPDHRDFVLTDSERTENASILVCVSRAHSAELVLDLP